MRGGGGSDPGGPCLAETIQPNSLTLQFQHLCMSKQTQHTHVRMSDTFQVQWNMFGTAKV